MISRALYSKDEAVAALWLESVWIYPRLSPTSSVKGILLSAGLRDM
jgi:hypothetical protein